MNDRDLLSARVADCNARSDRKHGTKRVYVAGPMSGLPGNNYDAFNQAAASLRARGFEVENPAENPEPACGSWLAYMRMAVVQVSKVDTLVLLPGWERSRGARVEFNLAVGLGLSVETLDALLQPAEPQTV